MTPQNRMEEKLEYMNPKTDVVELKIENIICESPGGGGNEDPGWNPGI